MTRVALHHGGAWNDQTLRRVLGTEPVHVAPHRSESTARSARRPCLAPPRRFAILPTPCNRRSDHKSTTPRIAAGVAHETQQRASRRNQPADPALGSEPDPVCFAGIELIPPSDPPIFLTAVAAGYADRTDDVVTASTLLRAPATTPATTGRADGRDGPPTPLIPIRRAPPRPTRRHASWFAQAGKRATEANRPIRKSEPRVASYRLVKLTHLRPTRLHVERERLRRHALIRTTTNHSAKGRSEHRRRRRVRTRHHHRNEVRTTYVRQPPPWRTSRFKLAPGRTGRMRLNSLQDGHAGIRGVGCVKNEPLDVGCREPGLCIARKVVACRRKHSVRDVRHEPARRLYAQALLSRPK